MNKKVFYEAIDIPEPCGSLYHEPTKCSLSCYKPIGWFKKLMLNWCFGLKYKKL